MKDVQISTTTTIKYYVIHSGVTYSLYRLCLFKRDKLTIYADCEHYFTTAQCGIFKISTCISPNLHPVPGQKLTPDLNSHKTA